VIYDGVTLASALNKSLKKIVVISSILFTSFVTWPSYLFKHLILFFFTWPVAFWWKNFVFLSSSFNQVIHDLCSHIISPRWRSSSNLQRNFLTSSSPSSLLVAWSSSSFFLILSISLDTAPNFSLLQVFSTDITPFNFPAIYPTKSWACMPTSHAHSISSGRESSLSHVISDLKNLLCVTCSLSHENSSKIGRWSDLEDIMCLTRALLN
jgi:hypothetical protein